MASVDLTNVTTIDKDAFYECTLLGTVSGTSLTTIGDSAFYGCEALKSIDLSKVTIIDSYAFYGCVKLSNIDLSKVTTVGNNAFHGCVALTEANLQSATSIGSSAFEGCSEIITLNLPSLTSHSLGLSAFKGCSKLSSLTIAVEANVVVSTSHPAFDGCLALSNLTLVASDNGEGFDYTELTAPFTPWALSETANLTVTIDDAVSSIGYYMFYECENLNTISISENMTEIPDYSFYGCVGLTTIDVSLIAYVGEYAFAGSSLRSIYLPVAEFIDEGAFDGCANLEEIDISGLNSGTTIGDYAFRNCVAMTSLTIPIGVNAAGNVFVGCKALENVVFVEGEDGIGFNYTIETYMQTPWALTENDVDATFDDGVISIGNYIFYGCNNLVSLTIYNSVSSIGYSAFYECASIESLDISNIEQVGIDAFRRCSGLKELTMSVGANVFAAFVDCYNIESVTLTPGRTGLGYDYTAEVTGAPWNAVPVTILDGVISIGNYMFYHCEVDSLQLPDSLKSIGEYAFFECVDLEEINLNKVEAIGDCAFYGCVGIEDGDMSAVETLGAYAFYQCTSLTYAELPSATAVGAYAFYQCTSLEIVDISDATAIGDYAFYGCDKLETIDISNVKTIGAYAFYGCASLVNIDLSNVETIDDHAFDGCESLVTVNLSSVTSLGEGTFKDCIGIVNLTIPIETDSVADILVPAFSGCVNIESVTFVAVDDGIGLNHENNYSLTPWAISGTSTVVMNKNVLSTGAHIFYECTNLETVVMDDVETINEYAFYGCNKLTNINIDGTKYIGAYAFHGCISLKEVEGSGLLSIGNRAFDGCITLESIDLSEVITIENHTFYNCLSLSGVDLSEVTTVGNHAFYGCVNLTEANLLSATSIGASAFEGCSEIITLNLSSVTAHSLGISAFKGCSKLSSLTIAVEADVVVNLDHTVFEGCEGLNHVSFVASDNGEGFDYTELTAPFTPWAISELTSLNVYIDDEVKSIGDYIFYQCENLITVFVSENMTEIPDYAFYGCIGLTTINVPLITHVGEYAFARSSLESIYLPAVKTIDEGAFDGCVDLEIVSIPGLDKGTSIADYAFRNCVSMTSLTIPVGVNAAGNVFVGCESLENVVFVEGEDGMGFYYTHETYMQTPWALSENDVVATFDEGVSSIGEYMFYGCNNLVSLTISDSVLFIADSAFYECASIETLDLSYVKLVEENAFYGCSGLKELTMPVEANVDKAFVNCSNIESVILTPGTFGSGYSYSDEVTGAPWNGVPVTILDGVVSIGSYMFYNCEVESLQLPDSLKSIGTYAFYGCEVLKEINLNKVESIGSHAFEGCIGIEECDMSAAGTLGAYAFKDCTSLAYVKLHSASTIPDFIFNGCTKLRNVDITGVTSIGESAFNGCVNLREIDLSNVQTIGESAFKGCLSLISVDLSNVTSLAAASFSNCSEIRDLIIPIETDSCVDSNNPAFGGCTKIKSVTFVSVTDGNGFNYPYEKATHTPWYIAHTPTIVIDENVKQIGDYTFYSGSYTSIDMPEVTSIGAYAFYNSSLVSVNMPEVTSIGNSAFGYCYSLTSVNMPKVTSIGSYAFTQCSSLTSIDMPEVTNIGIYAFGYCNSMTSVNMPKVTSIGNTAFRSCISLLSVNIPEVTSIGSYAFYQCYSLASVNMPKVISIGDHAFYECSSLNSVYITNIHTIGSQAFYGCSALQTVYTEANADYTDNTIGDYAFYRCINLERATLDATSIGQCAFENCSKLEEVELINVTEIGVNAFSYAGLKELEINCSTVGYCAFLSCTNLEKLTINCTSIGVNAFTNCTNLKELTINCTSIGEEAFNGCIDLEKIVFGSSVPDSAMSKFYYTFNDAITSIAGKTVMHSSYTTKYEIPCEVTVINFGNAEHYTIVLPPGKLTWEDLSHFEDGKIAYLAYDISNNPLNLDDYVFTTNVSILVYCKNDIAMATVDIIYDGEGYIYDGGVKQPTCVVTYKGTTLEYDVNYIINYSPNAVDVGTYNLTVSGINGFTGTNTVEWKIVPQWRNDITLEASNGEYNNGDHPNNLTITVKKDDVTLGTITGDDVRLSYSSLDVGTSTVTLTKYGNYEFNASVEFEIEPIDFPGEITNIPNQVYTGSEIEPNISFTAYSQQAADDYVVTYSDNINKGTATVSVTFNGNYEGTITKTFQIIAKTITENMVNVSDYTYDGTEQTAMPVITYGEIQLSETDFTVSYNTGTRADIYFMTIEGIGNYTGQVEKEWIILQKDISSVDVSIIGEYTYNGNEQIVQFDVYDGLIPISTDNWKIESGNTGVDADTYNLVIVAKVTGNYYGQVEKEWTILEKDISSVTVIINGEYTYDGNDHTVSFDVYDGNVLLIEGIDFNVTSTITQTNAGTYNLVIEGIGNYTGEKTAEWIINQKQLTSEMLTILSEPFTYNGSYQEVSFNVSDDNLLTENDWILRSSKTQKNAGTYTLLIEGKGNYSGTVSAEWTINKKQLTEEMVQIVSNPTYDGTTKTVEFTVSDGTALTTSDYSVSGDTGIVVDEYTLTITANVQGNYYGEVEKKWNIVEATLADGTITIENELTYNGTEQTVEFKVYYGSTLLVEDVDYEVKSTITQTNAGTYTLVVDGLGNYTGEKTAEWTINKKQLTEEMVQIVSNPTYDGTTKTVGYTVSDGTALTTSDYSVSGDTGVVVDEYTLIITATENGNYSGNVEVKWYIQKSSAMTVEISDLQKVFDATSSTVEASSNVTEGTTLWYSIDNIEWSTDVPTFLNVCDTVVYVKATNANYNDATDSCRVTITQKAVTVTAVNKEKTYGDADPELTVTVNGVIDSYVIQYTITRDSGENAGTYNIVVTGTSSQGNYTVTFVNGTFTINRATLPGSINDIASQTYTGAPIQPSLSFTDLPEDATYSVSYSNNVNVGTATVTVEGTGNYTGVLVTTFEITKKPLDKTMVSIKGTYVYDDSLHTVVFIVSDGNALKDTDWTKTSGFEGKDVGVYTLVITATDDGNYSGTASATWEILPSYPIDEGEVIIDQDTMEDWVEKAKDDSSTVLVIGDDEDGFIEFDADAIIDIGSDSELDFFFKLLTTEEEMGEDVWILVGGDRPVYMIAVGSDHKQFETGTVTIKLPYVLKEGEDPANLKIWYISDDGQKLEEIDCVYEDGFVIFVTNHLSIYSVMHIPPENAGFPTVAVIAIILAVIVIGAATFFMLKKNKAE